MALLASMIKHLITFLMDNASDETSQNNNSYFLRHQVSFSKDNSLYPLFTVFRSVKSQGLLIKQISYMNSVDRHIFEHSHKMLNMQRAIDEIFEILVQKYKAFKQTTIDYNDTPQKLAIKL